MTSGYSGSLRFVRIHFKETVQVQEPAEEVFNGDDACNDDPVHEPWSQLVLVIRLESLVTRKYREEKCDHRAKHKSAHRYKQTRRMSHDIEDSTREGGKIRDEGTDNAKHAISQRATQQISSLGLAATETGKVNTV